MPKLSPKVSGRATEKAQVPWCQVHSVFYWMYGGAVDINQDTDEERQGHCGRQTVVKKTENYGIAMLLKSGGKKSRINSMCQMLQNKKSLVLGIKIKPINSRLLVG